MEVKLNPVKLQTAGILTDDLITFTHYSKSHVDANWTIYLIADLLTLDSQDLSAKCQHSYFFNVIG